jgi:hypothetical protein
MTQAQKVYESLTRGPKTAKQLEHNLRLPKASAVISHLRREGFEIENRPFRNSAGKVNNKYVLVN